MDPSADSSASASAFHAGLIPSLLLRNLVVAQTQQVWSCGEGVVVPDSDPGKRIPKFTENNFRWENIVSACCFLVKLLVPIETPAAKFRRTSGRYEVLPRQMCDYATNRPLTARGSPRARYSEAASELMQLCVFGLGGDKDWNIRVGVLP
jgi:hypothetical protein